MTHTADLVCPRCENKLKDAHPKMAEWFRNRVKPKFPTAHISWSYRNRADQNMMVLYKRSQLAWPRSAHNRRAAIDPMLPFNAANELDMNSKPYAEALDLFEIIDGKAEWKTEFFQEVAQDIKDAGLDLIWGGNWKSLGDQDHFQLEFV